MRNVAVRYASSHNLGANLHEIKKRETNFYNMLQYADACTLRRHFVGVYEGKKLDGTHQS
jgi:hypothetical protein